MPDRAPVLEAQKISKSYRRFWSAQENLVLREVSFDLFRGELTLLRGKNGAGKTTLLKLLSRITYPTEGRILFHGRVQSLLGIEAGLHPELDVTESILLNGTLLGMPRRVVLKRFDEILNFAGLWEERKTPIKFLSTGLKARLAFSVATHVEGDVLLIDETLAVADPEFLKRAALRLEQLARAGRSILLTEHGIPKENSGVWDWSTWGQQIREVTISDGRLFEAI